MAWSLGLFGALRLNWTEAHVVLPVTQFQSGLAIELFGTPSAPIQVTLACSGTDALALCLAAILAYPAAWRSRLAGAGGGIALLLFLNTFRIGTLGRAAASPARFQLLHEFVWPVILTFAIAGYVFWWMRTIDNERRATAVTGWQPHRFFLLTLAFVLAFVITAPLYLQSSIILALAGVVAQSAAVLLNAMGVASYVHANVLSTPGGHFAVTQECITTPLIPIYLAAVIAFSSSRRRLAAALIATIPLFMALGIARLLLVALPPSMGSPLFVVHAFYQLALAIVVIGIAASWRHTRRDAWRYALAGIALAAVFLYLSAPVYALVESYNFAPIEDPQDAIAFLPVFQAAFYLALTTAMFSYSNWKLLLAGLAVLTVTQVMGIFVIQAITESGSSLAVRDVRAWAVVAPVLIVAVISHVAQPRR
jgi:exosortase/archaeosortase family protein